jgi:hypothetical protein
MVFSDTVGGTGILERARKFARVDATQWPTVNVVNSANDRLDKIMSYGISADRRFQLDDTNHTKLPIGTTNLVAGQSDYSFLTDEQNNPIINLTRIDVQDSTGIWRQLKPIDQNEIGDALDEFMENDSLPEFYDKIADNIIRLYPAPISSVTAGLKFYFQRTGSYFVDADTTKAPGVSPLLHRGFVIASAYDGALTLGTNNLSALAVELQKEDLKMKEYFAIRNTDEPKFIRAVMTSAR